MIALEHLAKRFRVTAANTGKPRAAAGVGSKFGGRTAPRIVHAVRDVSFEAADGRITGLLGPNGAGKTTTLRMLAGLITPDAGRMQVDGLDVASTPRAALARMGVLSDARGLYPRLTARENIVYYGRLQGMTRDAANARAEHLAGMFEMSKGRPGELLLSALVRAKFAELLGARVEHQGADLFLLGLLSMMDAILEIPMSAVIEGLPLDEQARKLLLEHDGELAGLYQLVSAVEAGAWKLVVDSCATLGVQEDFAAQSYSEAMTWAQSLAALV